MSEQFKYIDYGALSKENENYLPTIAIHRIDQKNVGDMHCHPDLYFKWLSPTKTLDIEDPNFSDNVINFENSAIIVGGGGLLFDGRYPAIYQKNFDRLYNSRRKLLVAWGIGHNNHDGGNIQVPDLEMYDIAGIRDYTVKDLAQKDSKYHWVPCASSLHPAFDKQYPIEHEVVFFGHKFHRPQEIINDSGIPNMDNSGQDAEEAIRFIASGETVLTTSYHGAYWGILLGRKVIIVNPFSTKFQGLKWEAPIASAGEWKSVMNRTNIYPEALNESREANNIFALSVRERLKAF